MGAKRGAARRSDLRAQKPPHLRQHMARRQLREVLGVATRMVKHHRGARTFVENPRKNSTRITHGQQELAKPSSELVFGRQRKDEHRKSLGSFARFIAPALNVGDVADAAVHDAAQHEQAARPARRTDLRVEPHPAATPALQRVIGPETQKLRRPRRLEPAFKRVPLDGVEPRMTVGEGGKPVPQTEQKSIGLVKGRGVNTRLADARVRAGGVTTRPLVRRRDVGAGQPALAKLAGNGLDGHAPTRADDDEIIVSNLDVAGASPGRRIRRHLDGVGRHMTWREGGAGLKRRGTGRGAVARVAPANGNNVRPRRERAAGNAVREDNTTAGEPLALHDQSRPAFEPGTHLEKRARGSRRWIGLVELRIDFACGTLRVRTVAQACEEKGIVFDERRHNPDDGALGRARLAGRGQERLPSPGPLIGGEGALELLGAAVAATEQLEARDPEGARRRQTKNRHPATRAEVVQPVAGRERGQRARALEAAATGGEIDAEAVARKLDLADRTSILDDVPVTIMAEADKGDIGRTEGSEGAIRLKAAEDDANQGLFRIAVIPQQRAVAAHDVLATQQLGKPSRANSTRKVGRGHRRPKGGQGSGTVPNLFLYCQIYFLI